MDAFRQILSPTLPPRYLMRQISVAWYQIMEEVYHHEPEGTRILVRRDRVYSPLLNDFILHDYITTRHAVPILLNEIWSHQDVAYREGEATPYPFDIDAFHDRDTILEYHRNNQNLNPLPEGHSEDAMEIALPEIPPLLSPFPFPFAFHALPDSFPMIPPPLTSSALLSAFQD